MNNSNLVNEILVNNGLDFTIIKNQLVGLNGMGTPYFGLFNDKTNECINTCKKGYEVSQNKDIVELVVEGSKGFGNLKVQKAGALNGGRKVFLQLEIEGVGKVANDTIKRYVTIIDSNDGSTSLSVGIGDFTMSCSNQFFKFYAKGDAKFRHTATMQEKIKTIPYLIEEALRESLRQIVIYNRLSETSISRAQIDVFVKQLLGYDRVITSMDELAKKSTQSINIMDKVYANIERETADKGLNLWGLHSGITRYTTHDISTPKRDNARIESLISGGGYNLNQASFEYVNKLILA